jgi:4-carboxymuconolactone decarboxylase
MGQMMRFQEILRKLAIIDEGFIEDQARLGLDPAGPAALDAKTAALVRVGVLAAIGAPAVGLEWGTTRALATGATADEITGVLLAIAPVAGLGRVVGAVTDVAAALGYDVEAALHDPDEH